ncbi:MAG: ABC transporter ATP-binding protein [Chloroflexi bacterium]|nr:ABC transporter ATP-binding protein [Chloroflexota bacterium]
MKNIPLRRYWDLLVDHLQSHKPYFVLLTVLLLSSIGLQVANPQLMRYFIDTATSGKESSQLVLVALAFIGVALFQQVLAVSATFVGENLAWIATNSLRAELAAHCLRLDMSFHNEHSPGELIERIDGDIAELSNFFSQLVIRVVGSMLLMAGILVVLFTENWVMGLGFTAFVLSALYSLNRVRSIAVPYDKALRESQADLFAFLEERLSGTEDIRANGAVDYVLHGLYKLHTVILQRWQKAWNRHVVVHGVAGMTLMAGYAIAFVSGYHLYRSGVFTIGTAYLVVYYTNLMSRPIRDLTQQVESLQNIGAAVERLSDLRAFKPKITDGPGAVIPTGPLTLRFDDVTFAYVDGEPVLENLNFELKPGRVLGLLGRTGSGKTTITRLVFRLYDISSGTVRINGIDVRDPRLYDLRRRVSMVTQDVQLFQASVRDNLTFFNRDIPDDRILAVIDDLELGDWYRALPKGLDTRLETGGRGLSAGQAQLLAFARVFLHDPGLVILDEASSRLDPATEQVIERTIDKLLRNRTAIIVAHRLGTVHRADEIMILDGGRVTEHGDRALLADDPSSRFYSLLQTGLSEVLV